MNDTDVFLGTAEAAEKLGHSRDWVEREVKAGHLTPAYRGRGTTGAMLFRRSDVEALAAARRGDAA